MAHIVWKKRLEGSYRRVSGACPYCGAEVTLEYDKPWYTNLPFCSECEHCGKRFWYEVEVTREYHSRKEDEGVE